MGAVGPLAPLDLVDLLLNLQALQVVKLWLVALELGPELVLTSPLLQHVPFRSVPAAPTLVDPSARAPLSTGAACAVLDNGGRTVSSRSNRTTRPPRSPVARYRPVSSNSTVEMMSAAGGADASARERANVGWMPLGGRRGPVERIPWRTRTFADFGRVPLVAKALRELPAARLVRHGRALRACVHGPVC